MLIIDIFNPKFGDYRRPPIDYYFLDQMAAVENRENPDLAEERKQIGAFDSEKLSQFFWGGSEVVRQRRSILDYIERCGGDELRPSKPLSFMSREEKLEDAARRVGFNF